MGDFERQRNIFICHYAYADRFSEGRYELWGIEEYAIKEYGFYQGIEIVDYKEWYIMNKKEIIEEILSGICFTALFFMIIFGGAFFLPILEEVIR